MSTFLTPESGRQIAAAVNRLDRTPTNKLAQRRRNKHVRGGGAGGGDTYAGQFNITFPAASGTANRVDVAAGKVISGLTVTTVAAQTDLFTTQLGFLVLAVWYNSGWKTEYQFTASTSYPTQGVISDGGTDYACFRKVIASYDTVALTWNQEHYGEVVNPRITG